MTLQIVLTLAAAVAVIGFAAFAFCYGRKVAWNNGACPCNNGFWVSFDTDSGGSTGYRCSDPKCRNHIWL